MMQITLRAARVNAGLSLRKAAEKIGVTYASLRNWEVGRSTPSYPQAIKLSEVYNMPLDNIFFGD